jgi:hypothetical protein
MLASLVLVGRDIGARGWLLAGCALTPALATLLLGLIVPSSYDVRYAIAGVPPFLVLLAGAATTWPRSTTGRALVAGTILLILGGALADQQLDPGNPLRFDFAAALASVQHDARPGDAVLYTPSDLRPVLRRDAPGLVSSGLATQLPTRAHAGNVFVIASFLGRPAVRALMNRDLGALRATRHLVRHRSYPGVAVWWYR